MALGSGSSTGGGGGAGVVCSGGVEVLFLLTDSTRAARAGNFLFLSMTVVSSQDQDDLDVVGISASR